METIKPRPEEVIEISTDDTEVKATKSEKPFRKGSSRKNLTSVLTARSKAAACGITKKFHNIDAVDSKDELVVVEYVEDIYNYYKLAEKIDWIHDYMDSQPEINEKMRGILVDSLIDVHHKFELMPETLYLTLHIVDRFLSVQTVLRKELQLVGIGVMLIACKYEEIWAPEINDFIPKVVIAPTLECGKSLGKVLGKSKRCVCILVKDRDDPQLNLKLNATKALTLPST